MKKTNILLPMKSALQFSVCDTDDVFPETYSTNIGGLLGSLQGEVTWHIHYICRFHQKMYADLNKKNYQLDEFYKNSKERYKKTKEEIDDEDSSEYLDILHSREINDMVSEEIEVEKIRKFADEYSIIGLWTTSEKYMSKIYSEIVHQKENIPITEINKPKYWNDSEKKFNEKSITLKILNGYDDANECRVLNNTIKHSGYVDDRLGEFPFFVKLIGEDLNNIEFEMQRYLNGVNDFLGSLIEAGNRYLDPKFSYNTRNNNSFAGWDYEKNLKS